MPRKSGTGCITCRIRRVKCDEQRPSCQRCTNSRRTCDGYLPGDSTVTRRQLAAAVRQLSGGSVSQALSQCPGSRSRSASPETFIFFDVFRHSTAPSTNSFLPSRFWTRELLQLAHSEPAIWHATVALGALHQRCQLQSEGVSDLDGLTRHAIEQHGRAISHAQQLNDATKLLALSLAFVSTTSLLGRWSESQVHILAGQRLLPQANSASAESATEMLTRLDLQAMTLSDSSAPYPFKEITMIQRANKTVHRTEAIRSYGQAGTELFALFRRLMPLDDALGVGLLTEEEYQGTMAELKQDIISWEYRMAEFERDQSTTEQYFYSVRLYHALVRLFMHASFMGPETRWDNYLALFERILACAESLAPNPHDSKSRRPLSLEVGLIIPLFVTSVRCRHPILRWRAIELLRKLKCQEGAWSSEGAAAVAARMATAEQSITGEWRSESVPQALLVQPVPWEAWSSGEMPLSACSSWIGWQPVPELKRICEVLVMIHVEQRRVDLSFIMSAGDQGKYGEVITDAVTF